MESIKLGPRLHKIASYVPMHSRIADIGTDHAYLPVYLLQNGIGTHAIGVDIHRGPYESALDTVKTYGLEDKIDIRFGNGLEPIHPGEVDTIVIAGMGGNTMIEILASKSEVLKDVTNLILQPQGAEAKVRHHLLQNGWKMTDECLVEDENRVYAIIHFSRQQGMNLNDVQTQVERLNCSSDSFINRGEIIEKYFWQFGPIVLQRKETLLNQLIQERLNHIDNILVQLKKTERAEVQEQKSRLKTEIVVLEELRKWLFP